MHRCLVKPGDWFKDRIPGSASDSHHLLHVLRVEPGELVRIFDGLGHDAIACVEIEQRGSVFFRVVAPGEAVVPCIELTLLQAVPKGHRMDLLVEKCTELGVHAIAPVLTERGVVRLDADRSERRTARWQRIAESAARQCGGCVVPNVRPLRPLPEAIEEETRTGGLFLVASLQHDARPLRDVLREVKPNHPERVTILIGPEGDLTDRELATAREHGAVPVGFGPLVFRVETAAMFAAAVIVYEFAEQ